MDKVWVVPKSQTYLRYFSTEKHLCHIIIRPYGLKQAAKGHTHISVMKNFYKWLEKGKHIICGILENVFNMIQKL